LPKVFTSLLVKQKNYTYELSQATVNISLPDSLKEYVKERMQDEHYSNASDYIRSLIREDQKRHEERQLEQLLLEGVRSGPGIRMDSKEWKKLWAEVDERNTNRP
jgi:antitoxin ParD1/3/4